MPLSGALIGLVLVVLSGIGLSDGSFGEEAAIGVFMFALGLFFIFLWVAGKDDEQREYEAKQKERMK
jgi:hypothetical protein